jgi:hypothetical protein
MPGKVARQHASTTSGRLATWSWYVAVLLAVWWLSFNPMRSADFWWHLASGRWIVEHRAMARLDPYSFSAHGRPWLNNEWLGDVLFFLWTSVAGLESLVYWFWGMLLATYGLLFHLCRQLGGSPLVSFVGVAMATAASAPFFEFRPNLYSLLLFVVLLWLLLPRRPLWPGLPLLFVAWVNLHPGFIFGLAAAAGVVAIDVAVDASRARRSGGGVAAALAGHRRDVLVVAGCALAGLLNPFGVQSYVHPLRWALDSASPYRQIKEWLPPFAQDAVSPPLFPYLIALFLAACLMLSRRALLPPSLPVDEGLGGNRPRTAGASSKGTPRGKIAPRDSTGPEDLWAILALGGVTLCMALASARFIPLFSILACLAISLLPAASRWWRSMLERRQPRPVLRTALPLVLAAACLAMLARFPLDRRAFRQLVTLESFPVDTLDFVEASRLSGRLLAYYGWGGYVQYRTRGRVQVYIDGRAATVYSPALFDAYRRVQYELPGWQEVVESSGADYVLWPNLETPQVRQIDQPRQLLASGRWRKVYEDFVSVLLARVTAPPAAAPAPPRPSPYRELALGGLAMRGGDKEGAETHLRASLRLDGDMLAACRNLALVLAWEDRASEAWAQHARCERIFPEPESAADLEALEARRRWRAQVLRGGAEDRAGRGQR